MSTPDKQLTKAQLPEQLPEKPTGWTKSLALHLNFGRAGGAASYEVKDEAGCVTPIGYHYDTRKGYESSNGFSLPGLEKFMSWAELRNAWPEWLKNQLGEGASQ